jgi:hypothetical protein
MPKKRLTEKINHLDKSSLRPWPSLPVRRAFKVFRLDPHNADDCKLVLTILAEEAFGRRHGRPSIPGYKLIALLNDYEVVKAQWPSKSESDICRKMQQSKMFGGEYSKVEPEAMRKRLRLARRLLAEIGQIQGDEAKWESIMQRGV